MAVRLWDAHYSIEDCIPLPVSGYLFNINFTDHSMALTHNKYYLTFTNNHPKRQEALSFTSGFYSTGT